MHFSTDQQKGALTQFARRQLEDIILPFWKQKMVDHDEGGFLGKIGFSGEIIKGHPKGIVLNARILWTFSAVYQLLKDPDLLSLADRAYKFIEDHFYDPAYEGYFWSLNPDKSIENGKKQIYAQAFVIYAFTEYAAAARLEEPFEKACKLAGLIEKRSFDKKNNGYLEAFSKDWGEIEDVRLSDLEMNEKKTTNNHLHIMEAYTRLHQFRRDPVHKERILNLIGVFREYFLQDDFHLGMFFNEQWELKSDEISFGHDIETAWLLYEAALTTGKSEIIERIKPVSIEMANAVLPALNREGGLFHDGHRNDNSIEDELEWWAQSEAIIGFLNAYEITGDEAWLDRALSVKNYIDKYFIDKAVGEWYFRVDKSGKPIPDYELAGPWKCPYHTSRMCLEIIRRLS